MLRKTTALALAAFLGTASPALAEEHIVMMFGDGFFPEILYIDEGDTVRFVNATEEMQVATATDDSWTTGSLGIEGEAVLTIIPGMQQVFFANSNTSITGTVFFGEAPLSD